MENLLKKLPFYNHTWFNFLRFLIRHFVEDNCTQKAASLTYTTMLSIVPMITVLLMILSSVPALESAREQIYHLIYSNLMPQSSMQVSSYINSFAEKSKNLTAIGALVLFVTTIMTLTTIERAFNQIWRVEERSGGIKSVIRYWTIVTVGPLVLGTAFIISSTVQSLSFLNQKVAGYGIDWSIWVQIASFAITTASFIAMYWFIPKAKVPIKNATVAGVFVAIIFELLKLTFGTVMTNFTSYEAVYGAFAALPIFLLWIYLSWNVILIGVEISYTLTIFATSEVFPRHPLLSLLDMLNLVYKRHQEGSSVSEQELRNVLGRKELPKWYTYLNYLQDSDLISLTDDEDYVLKKDLDNITLWDFYRTLPYPLPIKDELDQIDVNTQSPWLNLLVHRLTNTEEYAKAQLHISLSKIFKNSKPRTKIENPNAITSKEIMSEDGRFGGAFDAEAFDCNAKTEQDNQNNTAIIPENSDITSASNADKESRQNKHSNGLLGSLIHPDQPLITENDNPDNTPKS